LVNEWLSGPKTWQNGDSRQKFLLQPAPLDPPPEAPAEPSAPVLATALCDADMTATMALKSLLLSSKKMLFLVV
jgi:hypothetical protein